MRARRVSVRPRRAAYAPRYPLNNPGKSDMKLFLAFAAAALVGGPVLASPELAQQKNCMACHTVDKKLIGPAFKDVAKKFAGRKDAVAYLAERVQKGSVGEWGQVPMPPNQVTAEEAKTLVNWILTLK